MKTIAPGAKRIGELAVFALISVSLLQLIYDWDIWYHLSIGKAVAENWGVPEAEFLVFPNAGEPGEFHEWGFGLLFYAAYELKSFWAMSVLNAAIAGSTLWALFRASDANPWSSPAYLLVLLAVLLWMKFRLTYRPEMILYLAMACEIFLLERAWKDRQYKWLAPIPLLGFILSQAHASALILLVVLGFYVLQFAWEHRREPKALARTAGWFFLCGVATALLCVINPYGLEQLLLPVYFAQQERVTMIIGEFFPSLESVRKWQFISLAGCALTALMVARNKRVVDWLLLLFFGYLAYRYVRNIAMLALVMYVPMARGGADLLARSRHFLERRYSNQIARPCMILTWGLAAAAVVAVTVSNTFFSLWGAGPQPGQFPEKSVRVIRQLRPPGNMFNNYEFGGYLGWELAGEYPVFIDGRNFAMNKTFATYRSIGYTRAGWRKALEKHTINAVVMPPKILSGKLLPLLAALADDPAWALAVAENRELLFLRRAAFTELPRHYQLDKRHAWSMIADETERMIHYSPNDHIAHVTLADARLRLGDRQGAIVALRNYLALEPGDRETARRLAELEAGL